MQDQRRPCRRLDARGCDRVLRCFGLLTAALLAAPAGAGPVIFVNAGAPGGGDGTTWATAFDDLQDALAAASPGDQIWIADGVYLPDNGTGNPALSFQVGADVSLYGGFAGGETDLSQRDPVANPAILSGDLLGNDQPGFVNYADNSNNVVRITGLAASVAVTLDGLIVRGGNATGGFPLNQGGGLHFDATSTTTQLTIANCTFRENTSAGAGAGARLRHGTVLVTGSTFEENFSNDDAGALSVVITAVTITDCIFQENEASQRGGAVSLSVEFFPVAITNSQFLDNTAAFSGGGLFTSITSSHVLLIEDCTFAGNAVTTNFEGQGGGLSVDNRPLQLLRSQFIGNTAMRDGGGAYLQIESGSAIINCDFRGNESLTMNGGGLELIPDSTNPPVIVNNLFVGNAAALQGGGLRIPTSGGGMGRAIRNCTFAANSAGTTAGGLLTSHAGDTISNCILWANTDSTGSGQSAQLVIAAASGAVNYCCVQGWTGSLGGTGNHGNNPLFVDLDGADNVAGTDDDDLQVGAGSPCIDVGDNTAVSADVLDLDGDANTTEPVPFDLEGDARFLDLPAAPDGGNGTPPIVDMGVYEAGMAEVPASYVGPPGGSWFIPSNWSTGQVPGKGTTVIVASSVIIAQPGAVAAQLTIESDGSVTISTGSLTVDALILESGGTLSLTSASAELTVGSMSVSAGATLVWSSGTIRVIGGTWVHPVQLNVGCAGVATLRVEDGGEVSAPSIVVCASGSAFVSGQLTAAVTNDGLISAGATPGQMTIAGSYTQGRDGTLLAELSGYGTGEYDTVVVTGAATLDGTLDVDLLGGFTHLVGGRQTLVSGNPVGGSFATELIPPLPGDADFLVEQSASAYALFTMVGSTGARVYVDADATGDEDGQSWATAVRTLEGALAIASFFPGQVTEAWVAEGVYVPSKRLIANDPRSVTFQVVDGLSLYGGFAGGETDLDQRDPDLHVTTLSGDLAGDDRPGFVNDGENAYRVLYASFGNPFDDPPLIDGFTVTAANGTGSAQGGGAWVDIANPSFRDCTFTLNRQGPGLRLLATAEVEGCSFTGNIGGGLIVPSSFVTVAVRDCLFDGNDGGGLSFEAEAGVIDGCVVINNTSDAGGGGAVISSTGVTHLSNSLFAGNDSGADGGGLHFGSNGIMTNCVVIGNNADDWGGGLNVGGSQNPVVANCLIIGNTTDTFDGGGVVFSVSDGGVGHLVNCTIANNVSGRNHGGVTTRTATQAAVLTNCLVWGNSDLNNSGEAAQIGGAGSFDLDYCTVEDWTGGFGGVGNNGSDPLFADIDGIDNVAGTEDDDLSLLAGSPAIDAGDNTVLPVDAPDADGDLNFAEISPIDAAGNERLFDDPATRDTGNGTAPIVDRGCYEFGAPPANGGLSVGPSGGSWFNPRNWANGAVPDGDTDAIITTLVVIGQSGAEARYVLIHDGGTLAIGNGSLTAGSMVVAAGGTLRLEASSAQLTVGDLDILAGGTLDWIAGTILVQGGTFTIPVALTVGCSGSATLQLAGGATVDAPSVSICAAGALRGDGTIAAPLASAGLVAPGASAGALAVTGDYSQTASGTLAIELAGSANPSQHDALSVTGTATLAGALTVTTVAPYQPALAEYIFLPAGAFTGTFRSMTLPPLSGGFTLHFDAGPAALRLIAAPPGPVVYIDGDATGVGKGTSWADASPDLQLALTAARFAGGPISELWVTGGTYVAPRPADPADARTASFELADGAAVYAGFAGGETERAQRNPIANVTILSGDVAGDDEPGFVNAGENLYHVATSAGAAATAVLDGFRIQGGNANNNAGFPTTRGGGIYPAGGSPTIRNCTLTGNHANGQGGAVFNDGGAITLHNCTISGNVVLGQGGAVANFIGSDAVITDCLFDANEAGASGGAISNQDGSSPVIDGCTFTGNLSQNAGGAIGNDVNCDPVIVDSFFSGNSASSEGGAISNFVGSPFVVRCTFVANAIGIRGGAVFNEANAPTFVSCTFFGCTAETRGGAIANISGADVILTNCLFSGNSAVVDGGAIHNFVSTTTLTNCTLAFNEAENFRGGGIHNGSGTANLANCILWGNIAAGTTNQPAQIFSGAVVVNYSTLQGWTGSLGGIGNNGLNPAFTNPSGTDGIPGTEDDNLQLFIGSPAIDAASNSALPADVADLDGDGDVDEPLPRDLANNARRADDPSTPDSGQGTAPVVDKGAYEFGAVCARCPGTRLWIDQLGGSFDDSGNWFPDAPAPTDGVLFNLAATYTVNFPGPRENPFAVVTGGYVTFALNGHEYSLTSKGKDALQVGELPETSGSLILAAGSVSAPAVAVGGQVGASGELILDAATLDVAGAVVVGELTPGSIVLENGAIMSAGAGVTVHPQVIVSGSGDVTGNLDNFGTVDPGAAAPGTLALSGDYEQVAAGGGILRIDIEGSVPGLEYDQFEIGGAATLGGSLVVTSDPAFQPVLGQTFTVLTASSISGTFDIVFLPPLPGDLVLTIDYNATSVDLVVAELQVDLFTFDDPVVIGGLPAPTTAGLVDIDGDGDEDIVMGATTGPDDDAPGLLLVFLNLGTNGMGDWLGYASPVSRDVLEAPSSIAPGYFDDDLHLDLAVAILDGEVSVLLNNGTGDGTFTEHQVLSVKSGARSAAAGGLYGGTVDDLVILTAAENRQRFFTNDGTGTFSFVQTVNAAGIAGELDTADLENDGDLEVVEVGTLGAQVTFRDERNGFFGPADVYPLTLGPTQVVLGDVDGSGFTDVVAVNGLAGLASILLNLSQGDGALSAAIDLQVGTAPSDLVLVDLDGDDDLDLAVAAEDEFGSRVVRLKRNELTESTPLTFTDTSPLVPDGSAHLLLGGDVNRDGRPDLISIDNGTAAAAAGGGGSMSIHVNQTSLCVHDLNDDGIVGITDLLSLLAQWGTNPGGPPDFDGDGSVGITDLLALLVNWGPCPD